MGGKHLAINLLSSACLFPFIFFLVWSIINTIAWRKGSTAAIPFLAALTVVAIWLLI